MNRSFLNLSDIALLLICLLCRLQSQVDVDSGIETMEVDEIEMRQEAKRRRVCTDEILFCAFG